MSRAPRLVGAIQARMGSTRLPGKVLLPLAGAPLLQRLVERVRRSQRLDALVVATTDTPADDPIADLCTRIDVPVHRGSEDDVLARMLGAAQRHAADILVRLTADNPMVDGGLVDLVADAMLAARPPPDYAHSVDGTGFPFGLFVEAATMASLNEAAREADAEEREHVTLFLRRRPGRYRMLAVTAPGPFALDRVTVDTAEEYEQVRALFEEHYRRDPAFSFRALLRPPTTETIG
ncbi:MAG: NTP transferase domain-containing protein [Rhodospirillaceae bacterium]|nr:NTP transferase domain-containing protein [Rhodospirillaceae bacterium]